MVDITEAGEVEVTIEGMEEAQSSEVEVLGQAGEAEDSQWEVGRLHQGQELPRDSVERGEDRRC